MPEGFAPDAAHQTLAAELGVSLAEEFPKFLDYHLSKGSRFVQWERALRTWLRNAQSYGRGRGGAANGKSDHERLMQSMADRQVMLRNQEAESEKK